MNHFHDKICHILAVLQKIMAGWPWRFMTKSNIFARDTSQVSGRLREYRYMVIFISQSKNIVIAISQFFCHPPKGCLTISILSVQHGTRRYSARLVGDLLSVCIITVSYQAIYCVEYNYWWCMWRNSHTYTRGMSGTVAKRGLNIDLWCQGHPKCFWSTWVL